MAEKKTTKAAPKAATKAVATKTTKKAATPKVTQITINAENVGFKAGDCKGCKDYSRRGISRSRMAFQRG